jgi:hypothetical protein
MPGGGVAAGGTADGLATGGGEGRGAADADHHGRAGDDEGHPAKNRRHEKFLSV